MPRMEPAPGRLSTRTVCLRRFVSSGEMMRPTTSVLPPGAHATSRRTDFSGHAAAAMQDAAMHARERPRTAILRRDCVAKGPFDGYGLLLGTRDRESAPF